jgi:hypothetical protein
MNTFRFIRYFYGFFVISTLLAGCSAAPLDYETFSKYDSHVHINTKSGTFAESAEQSNFRLLTIVTGSSSSEEIRQEVEFAAYQHQQNPDWVNFATTISMEDFGTPEWEEETIRQLAADFDKGAIAVKVWKDIGMVFRDENGDFIQIDDPRFDPVLDFIASENKTLVAHIGEPLNCWLPLDSMTVNNDRNYFRNNPQYHMYKHPEYPSHGEIMAARDHMLEKHPDLRVVGAHLGSLEYDTDVLAATLDKYPNFAVDMAARIPHFQVQERTKVRNFIVDYADRLIYATDIGASESSSAEYVRNRTRETWREDWLYFTTTDTLTAPEVNEPFRGLELDSATLEKIYYQSAVKWLPGS